MIFDDRKLNDKVTKVVLESSNFSFDATRTFIENVIEKKYSYASMQNQDTFVEKLKNHCSIFWESHRACDTNVWFFSWYYNTQVCEIDRLAHEDLKTSLCNDESQISQIEIAKNNLSL